MPKESLTMIYDFSHETDLFENAADMWDELNNTSKSSLFFYPASRAQTRIRLLGPHFKASRVFVPTELNLPDIISEDEFRLLMLGDKTVKAKVTSHIHGKPRNSFTSRSGANSSNEINRIEAINKITDKDQWQSCLLINGYVYDAKKIQINTFTSQTLGLIKDKIERSSTSNNKKINGILAHDIVMSNTSISLPNVRSRHTIPDLTIDICNEATLLSKEGTTYVLKQGLLDIPKVIKYSNNIQLRKMSGYFYVIKDIAFRAPDTFTKDILQEEGRIRQNQNLKEMLGYDKDNLPPEAIEDQEDTRNPIMNMEIE